VSDVIHQGSCHCGTVRFEAYLSEGLNTARRCTCSMCRMRGAIAVSVPLDGLRFVSGTENLSIYSFNTHVAQHYFCKTCGIYTHHKRRSNPNEFGVNVACLKDISPFDFTEVIVHNGVRHPNDDPDAPMIAGTLHLNPA
jgi:hypothetical protein